jgi:integrase/recombinase XerD
MAKNMTEVKAAEYLGTRIRLSKSSKDALRRRYKLQAANVKYLVEIGEMSTTSPALFTEKDFLAFVQYRASLERSPSDFNHHVSAMNKLMLFCGNRNGEKVLERNDDLRMPVPPSKKNPLSKSVYKSILSAYEGVDKDDFVALRPYAMVLMYICTGCRNKELRMAMMSDLDTETWFLSIRHPKGEDSYGQERHVPIPNEFRPMIENYLRIRTKWVKEHRIFDPGYLFFPLSGDDEPLSSNSVRRIKDKVATDIGAHFELRDCRRFCGQRYLENGVPLEIVAALLGHSNIKTTQSYYVTITNEMVFRGLDDMWAKRPAKTKKRQQEFEEDGKAEPDD